MEFSDFSDDEPSVAYDDYIYTPHTDPSAVTPLWKEHFQRSVTKRNPEVKRAFEVECSIYQFMYPELTRADVITKVTRHLKNKTKPSKKPFKLAFKTLVGSDDCRKVVNTEVGSLHKECELKSEPNEPQEKYSDVTDEEKTSTDTNKVTKFSCQWNEIPITSLFLDEKFIAFEKSNKFPFDNTDLKPRKIYPAKQSAMKSKLRGSTRGETLKCNEGILDTEKSTDIKCTQRTWLAPLKIIKTQPKGKTKSPFKTPAIIERAKKTPTVAKTSKEE